MPRPLYPLGKELRHPFNRSPRGLQSRSGHFGEEEKSLLGIEPQIFQTEADSLYWLSYSGFVWCGKELTTFSQESTAVCKHGSKLLRNVCTYLTIRALRHIQKTVHFIVRTSDLTLSCARVRQQSPFLVGLLTTDHKAKMWHIETRGIS